MGVAGVLLMRPTFDILNIQLDLHQMDNGS